MRLEPDPRLRRVIARKCLDRTIPDAGIGPADVYCAWLDGHASSEDAIGRIRELAAAAVTTLLVTAACLLAFAGGRWLAGVM